QLVLGPAVFDRDVLAVGIACLLQSLQKSALSLRGRYGAKESDYGHRRLLRPALSGHAAAPPSSAMNLRRFTGNFSRASKRKIALRETYRTAGFQPPL